MANNLTYQSISPGNKGIYLETNSNKTTWYCIHKVIFVSLKRCNFRKDLWPGDLSCFGILSDNTWSNFYLISSFEHTFKDGTTGNSSLKGLSIFTRLVHIERPDNNKIRRCSKISKWNGDSAQIVNHNIYVEFKLCGNWNNGSIICYGASNKFSDVFMLFLSSSRILSYDIDLVLQNNNVLQLHDFNSC